ncbi:uncharacterized protein LOC127802675 isoform X2 [Diospyros lotus]|uniref:uncharacterized protein LOC127802675 isoform X2 n=1 Tax=Diospyros lotus TaxID=55363 RepID=UPI00225572FB|nr:uncharacterized protein LOC127802675 isoform X2 [Diospyros lotus]
MAFRRLQTIRCLHRALLGRESSPLIGSSRSYSNIIVNGPEIKYRSISFWSCKCSHGLPWTPRNTELRYMTASELNVSMGDMRLLSSHAKPHPQARQMGSFKVSMSSPGIIYEPYAPREPIAFWRRWFTRSGWRRTKEDIILELKSAYAIAKLRKSGYSKQKFYKEALHLYKEINTQISNGDKTSLRKTVTENMYSALKNEIKQRESMWSKVFWELVEPVVKIRTLRARLIGVDRNDLKKVFIQLTLEFLTKQKFEAYDSKGAVVAGDKNKEVLVREIWVFEKSLFHAGAYWRLCGRIKAQPA